MCEKMRNGLWMILLLSSLLLMTGCTNKTTSLDNSGDTNGIVKDERTPSENEATTKDSVQSDVEASMTDYFPPDGTTAHYQGEGNEFAELDITFHRPFENYVILHENNGGALLRKVYRIDENQIFTLSNEIIENESDFPSLEELEAMEPIDTYLEAPFTKGKTFSTWKVTETGQSLETPYKVFTDVFIIEETAEGATNRKYFAPGFGEIKREALMEGDFVVTSTLVSVNE